MKLPLFSKVQQSISLDTRYGFIFKVEDTVFPLQYDHRDVLIFDEAGNYYDIYDYEELTNIPYSYPEDKLFPLSSIIECYEDFRSDDEEAEDNFFIFVAPDQVVNIKDIIKVLKDRGDID